MDHSIRAGRPSRHGIDPDMVAEAIHAKETAIRLYRQLIERGLPLFEQPGELPDTPSPDRPITLFPDRVEQTPQPEGQLIGA
ncbi:MAG: hypothetical protein ACOCXY_03130 [Planctomycetota bacterium]